MQLVGVERLVAATPSTVGEPARFVKARKGAATNGDQGQGVIDAPPSPVVAAPTFADPSYRFELLQQWECIVRTVSDDEFVAVLYDLTDRDKAEEEATFSLEDVADGDRVLVEPGAVFYWSIGYRTNRSGEKIRIAQIRFRRLPVLTARERREAANEVDELRTLLHRDDHSGQSAR